MSNNTVIYEEEKISDKKIVTGETKLLLFSYFVLAIAATARSLYQIIRDFEGAPLAYTLSALAALVYLLAAVSVANMHKSKVLFYCAKFCIFFELIGVLIVGSFSLIFIDIMHRNTVWSYYGMGYFFIPLFLPIWGLFLLSRLKKYSE